jgi:hypothetical protein
MSSLDTFFFPRQALQLTPSDSQIPPVSLVNAVRGIAGTSEPSDAEFEAAKLIKYNLVDEGFGFSFSNNSDKFSTELHAFNTSKFYTNLPSIMDIKNVKPSDLISLEINYTLSNLPSSSYAPFQVTLYTLINVEDSSKNADTWYQSRLTYLAYMVNKTEGTIVINFDQSSPDDSNLALGTTVADALNQELQSINLHMNSHVDAADFMIHSLRLNTKTQLLDGASKSNVSIVFQNNPDAYIAQSFYAKMLDNTYDITKLTLYSTTATMEDSDATAVGTINLDLLKNTYYFSSDNKGSVNTMVSNTDLHFFTFPHNSNDNDWSIVHPLQSQMSINPVDFVPGDNKVAADILRHISKSLFNTPKAVDLFANAQVVQSDLEALNVASYITNKVYDATETSDPLNFGGVVLSKILSEDANRIRLLPQTPDKPNHVHDGKIYQLWSLPFMVGDVVMFRVIAHPDPSQTSIITNPTYPVSALDRSYRIMLTVV